MLNRDTLHLTNTPIEPLRPTARDGALGAARAVTFVVFGLAMLALTGYTLFLAIAGEFLAVVPLVFGISIAGGVTLVFALLAAIPLGALLARCNVVAAALLVAPIAGFLVPFALFQDEGLAAGCGTVSILVGFIFATDNRFNR